MLTVLTLTGDRPDAWALCERWMTAQTRRPDQWLVIDDGREPARCTMGQDVLRLPCPDAPSGETFCAKHIAAIDSGLIRGDRVVYHEDDDWYAPHWLETMALGIRGHAIAGEGMAHYYHVGIRGIWRHANQGHASLCHTAIDASLLPTVRSIAETGNKFIDLALWRAVPRDRNLWFPETWKPTCVGIKGMPGRAGLASGHQTEHGKYAPDHDVRVLRMMMGADADAYARFYGSHP